MWQEAAKHVQGTKLGQNERSFECKSGNVKSCLSEARCLLGGGLPSPRRPRWETSPPVVLVTVDYLEALCSHFSFPCAWRSFYFLFSPLPKSSKEKRRKISSIEGSFLIISDFKFKWWKR